MNRFDEFKKIKYCKDVSSRNIVFHWDNNDLVINYFGNDDVRIKNQKIAENRIEKVELSNGNYLTDSDIDVLIQNMTSFANNNGIDLTNRQEVRNNSELMNLVSNAWKEIA